MNNIAFDLDGVFIPDCEIIPELGDQENFYNMTLYMQPIFVPKFEYDIITARPHHVRSITEKWCKKHLNLSADSLYHERENESAEEYKLQILNDHPEVRIYIESDSKIVDYLRQNVNTECNIILFSDFILMNIELDCLAKV